MALTVFDAIGKFHSDTSELDQFIAKLERGIPDASGKAAAATAALKQAQDEFRASIKAVNVEGGNTATNMQRLADAEKNLTLATVAAKQEHAALRSELTQTKQSVGLMASATDELTAHFTKMLGIVAAIEGFKSLIEGTQKSVLNLELLSEKTGIAIDTLAGLEHVSEAAGVSFDDVSTALVRLSRAQALAAEGGKQQVTAFERIGISVKELNTLSPEQLFYRVAEAMANSKNHAEANASAFALLGRGGAALIPIFQQGGAELHSMVEEAAKASGVTKEAGDAAREWQGQLANLSETVRAGLIPIMQLLVPVMKGVEDAGSHVALIIRDLAAAIGGLALAEIDAISGMAKALADVTTGNFKQAGVDTKASAESIGNDIGGIGIQFKENWKNTADSIKQIWTNVKPIKPATDDLSDLGKAGKDAGANLGLALLDAQRTMGAALIDLTKAQEIERISVLQNSISLEQAASKADFAERLTQLVSYDFQRKAIEAKAAEDEYQAGIEADKQKLSELQKHGEKTLAEQFALEAKIQAAEDKHQQNLIDTATKGMDALRKVMSQPIPLITEVPPGTDQISDEITKSFDKAKDAAAGLGITLSSDLNAALQKSFDDYAKLTDQMKRGVVTEADAKNGYIALVKAQLDFAVATKASTSDIAKLQRQLDQLTGKETANLDKFGKHSHATFAEFVADLKNGVSGMQELESFGVSAFDSLSQSLESAVASAILGQESFGKALENATAQALSQIAAQALVKALFYTAEGFAALAGFAYGPASEYFEAAGIMAAVGAAAGISGHALAGAASSGSSASSYGTPGPAAGSPASTAGAAPSQGVNTTHLGTGGIVSQRTFAMLGDDPSGSGDATEAILPLNNRAAMNMVADALVPAMIRALPGPASTSLLTRSTIASASLSPTSSSRSLETLDKIMDSLTHGKYSQQHPQQSHNKVDVHLKVETDIPHAVRLIAPEMSKQVNNGNVKLLASDSKRFTPRS